MLKSFVKWTIAFLGSCFSASTGILSGPGALSLCIFFSIVLISFGLVKGMSCVGGMSRYRLTSRLVLLWKFSCVKSLVLDLKFLSSVSAIACALS